MEANPAWSGLLPLPWAAQMPSSRSSGCQEPSSLPVHLDGQSCWQASLLQEGRRCQGLDSHPERLGRGKPMLASDSRTRIPGFPLPSSTKEEK